MQISDARIGGFATGGGMGRTDRVHGFAVDNLLAATVVTADGRIVNAGPDENEDLYWGIRGGGSNFGVVTEFSFRLHPFSTQIYGGSAFYPWSRARDLLHHCGGINDSLPDAASIEPCGYTNAEGERILHVQLYYAGRPALGEQVFAEFTKATRPQAIDLGMKSYSAVQTMFDAQNLFRLNANVKPAA